MVTQRENIFGMHVNVVPIETEMHAFLIAQAAPETRAIKEKL